MLGELWKLCGVAMLAAMLGVIIKKWNLFPSELFKVAAAVFLAIGCFSRLSPVLDFLLTVTEGSAVAPYLGVLFRVLAVSLITALTASVCRDLGESTLAGYVELGGRIEILILSLPLLEEILSLVTEMTANI